MSIELDPQEVLEHLYSLGYYNITKEQLKEFMKGTFVFSEFTTWPS